MLHKYHKSITCPLLAIKRSTNLLSKLILPSCCIQTLMPLKWGTALWLSSGASNQIWRPNDKEWFVFTVQWDILPLIKGIRLYLCIVERPCCAWLGCILKAALMHWCQHNKPSVSTPRMLCTFGTLLQSKSQQLLKPSKPLRDPEDAERSYDEMMHSWITLVKSF